LSWTAARKNSFQAERLISAVAARPGLMIGIITSRSYRTSPGPSTRAASMTSAGTSSRNERIIHTAIGRLMAVDRTIGGSTERWPG